MILLRNKVLNQ